MPQMVKARESSSADQDKVRVAVEKRITRLLGRCLNNLMALADGITVEKTDKDGQTKTYERPPDRGANEYILNRILGKPAPRKAIADPEPVVAPRRDLTRIPLDRLETMERWLTEADEQR
jgi:hypothetical protein